MLSYMNQNDVIKDDYTVLDRPTCGAEWVWEQRNVGPNVYRGFFLGG